MYCKYCGEPIDSGSLYCKYCGKPVNEDNLGCPDVHLNKDGKSKFDVLKHKRHNRLKKKIILWSLCALLLVCAFWGAYHMFYRKKIADVTIDRVSQELAESVKKYDELGDFHEGLARVCRNKKYGFIDKLGHEIIQCVYDSAGDFNLGECCVKKGQKVGAVNKYGDIVIPFLYDDISLFGEDSLAVASLNGKQGFINLNGNIVISIKYEICNKFSEGLAAVRQNGLYGFIDKKGRMVIPCKYKEIGSDGFSEGLIGVSIDGEIEQSYEIWGYIDTTGETVIPFQEGLTGFPFKSGITACYRGSGPWLDFIDDDGVPNYIINKKDGDDDMVLMNKDGEFVSDFFEQIDSPDGDGSYVISGSSGMGVLNKYGEVVIPCKYSFIAHDFNSEYVIVGHNGENGACGIISKTSGEFAIPIMYKIANESEYTFKEGVIPLKKDGKIGYINESNQNLTPFIYDEAHGFSEGFAVVKRYGKYGYVDRYGHDTFNVPEQF